MRRVKVFAIRKWPGRGWDLFEPLLIVVAAESDEHGNWESCCLIWSGCSRFGFHAHKGHFFVDRMVGLEETVFTAIDEAPPLHEITGWN